MSINRRYLAAALAAVMVAFVIGVGAASADTGHFHSASSSVASNGALVVTFDERGLGNGDVTYTVTADATALYACINGGGRNPRAANKQQFEGSVSGGGSFEARNGRVQGEIRSGPLTAPQFTCPSGQRRVLASVSYTNIVLTDTTNDVSIGVPDAQRTFVNV